MTSVAISSPITERNALLSKSYTGLLLTQFLGAFNDNMFRWLAVPIGQRLLTGEHANTLALVLGGVCFTIPYLLLTAAAGSLADRYSKRNVIVGCKVAEIVIMALGILAITSQNMWFLFLVVTLMGTQSALFGPAKLGSLPEMLTERQLSQGNGVMGLVTVVASALGTVAGFQLFGVVREAGLLEGGGFATVLPAGFALLGVAVAGAMSSLLIQRLPAANPQREPTINPLTGTLPALRLLWSQPALFRTALGIGFFWMLASFSQLTIDPFGEEILGLAKEDVGVLLAILVGGLGAGSVLAGWWSGGKVELGIVPLGTIGIIVSSLMLFLSGSRVDASLSATDQSAFWWSCVWLFGLGAGAGLFNIPLEAFLQHRSDERTRGTILAGRNFVSFSLILISFGLFFLLHGTLGLSPDKIYMITGLATIPVAVYVFKLLPDVTVRFLLWLASHTIYRLKVFGRENLPEKEGVLLVANHVSWVDGILVLISSSRMVRFLVYADYAESPFLRRLTRILGVIPIKATSGPKALLRSLQTAREAIQNGEVVCIFAEGSVTRTGEMQKFQPGLLRIVKGTGAPVVPIYLHGLWGSIFSHEGGRIFWKWPRKWPYPVSIHFGKPLSEPDDVRDVQYAVEELGEQAVKHDAQQTLVPIRQCIRNCKKLKSKPKVADFSGLELTGGKFLAGAIAMKRVLEREVLATDEKTVGTWLPPSVGGALANVALALGRCVSANLNYTMTPDVVNHCVREAGIKHVLTSRKFVEKKPLQLENAEPVFLEDLKERVTSMDKLMAATAAYVLPAAVVDRMLGLTAIEPDELLTIIFTSGSTGRPKGAMLSQSNIGSNVLAVDEAFNLRTDDVLMGILPFFHSFGYMGCMWLPLCYEPKGVYHANPLDSRMIGKLSKKHHVTILMSTPTFLKSYLKRVEPEQFAKLNLVVTGAEKLPLDLAEQFRERFDVMPSEGYGTTELSPAVALNIPDDRLPGPDSPSGTKLGTIGRPIPGVQAKILDPDSGEDLALGEEGLLQIKGPNVMLGYLNDPEKTAEAIRDGWYNTGDIARIDEEGFITITGRLTRFSKIGGEMVPHILIEEKINATIEEHSSAAVEGKSPQTDPDQEPEGNELLVAVTSIPDAQKGERIVVLHRPLTCTIEEVRTALSEAGLPNLWIPSKDSFVEVDEIPLLGTGKLDLRAIKEMALKHFQDRDAA